MYHIKGETCWTVIRRLKKHTLYTYINHQEEKDDKGAAQNSFNISYVAIVATFYSKLE
jgi:hypothetical protein